MQNLKNSEIALLMVSYVVFDILYISGVLYLMPLQWSMGMILSFDSLFHWFYFRFTL